MFNIEDFVHKYYITRHFLNTVSNIYSNIFKSSLVPLGTYQFVDDDVAVVLNDPQKNHHEEYMKQLVQQEHFAVDIPDLSIYAYPAIELEKLGVMLRREFQL